jgi:hypothetical protein
MQYLVFILGFFLIVLVLFAGCATTPSRESGVELTSQPDPSRNGLNTGDSAIFEYKGFKKSVRVTGFNETSGIVFFETQNTGTKAIATKSRLWIVDSNGVQYDLPEPDLEGVSPGESRPGLVNIYQVNGMQDSIKKGNTTIYYGFGNQEASWIIN